MKLTIFLGLFLLFSVSAVSALELTDDSSVTGVNIIIPTATTGGGGAANSSSIWNTTSLGELSDASSTQFENNGGVLTILTSYLNAGWCKLTGCDITGNVNVDGNVNITGTFYGDGSGITGIPGATGLWNNVSGVATYPNANVTQNLTAGGCTFWHNGTHSIEDC